MEEVVDRHFGGLRMEAGGRCNVRAGEETARSFDNKSSKGLSPPGAFVSGSRGEGERWWLCCWSQANVAGVGLQKVELDNFRERGSLPPAGRFAGSARAVDWPRRWGLAGEAGSAAKSAGLLFVEGKDVGRIMLLAR